MLVNLRALFAVVVDIVLLRRGPDDLPASPAPLAIVVVLFIAVSALTTGFLPGAPPNWPLQMLADLFVMMLWYFASLGLANKSERAIQTVMATIAVTTLFCPLLIPLSVQLQPYLADPEHVTPPPAFVQIPAVILGIWLFVVLVRIVRSAFEWGWFPAILYVFAQNLASAYLLGMLFGASTPAT